MLLLLDAKDLIELIERSQPMPVERFATWLSERGAKIVLTFTNVSEFANCFDGVNDLLHIRAMIQALERLPLAYLHEASIEVNEMELAIAAFDRGDEPAIANPYVSRWDHTFTKRGEAPPAEMIVGLRLDEIAFQVLRQPNAHQRRHLPRIALSAITDDRAIPGPKRLPPCAALTRVLEKKIGFWQLEPPARGVEAFGKWIFANPIRCPGLRHEWELVRALVANGKDALQDSDLWDHAHFPAIPYVEFATLDRRMVGYCSGISAGLAKQNSSADYRSRVFGSLRDLVTRVG
jgi:hypothetical protein